MNGTFVSRRGALTAIITGAATALTARVMAGRYASYWNCSNGHMYGLIANGNNRSLYLPAPTPILFFSGRKQGNSYVGTVYVGTQQIPVSGPISNNQTRVTLYANDGRSWVLNYSHK